MEKRRSRVASARITQTEMGWLKTMARVEDRTVSWVVCRLIQRGIEVYRQAMAEEAAHLAEES